MRNICSLLLILLLSASILTACGTQGPAASSQNAEIEAAWSDWLGSSIVWYAEDTADNWTYGVRHYGNYSGYDILFFPLNTTSASAVFIAGEIFDYAGAFELIAYRDGVFLPLLDVYEDGLIGAEEIAQIADTHQAYHDVILDLNLEHYGFPTFHAEKRQTISDAISALGHDSPNWCDPAMGEIDFTRYYGTYEGYDILLACDLGPSSVWPIRIGSTTFRHKTPFRLYAHKDGVIRSLEELYADGLIRDESVAKAANVHQQYCEMLYMDRNGYDPDFAWAEFEDIAP